MANLVIDKDELLAHSTDDGNVLTELSGAVMQKKLWSDVFGSSLDAAHWTVDGYRYAIVEGGSVTEAAGVLDVAVTAAGAWRHKGVNTAGLFNDLTAQVDFSNVANVNALWAGFGIMLWKDVNNYVYIEYNKDANTIYFIKMLAGVQTGMENVATGGVTSGSLKIQRTVNFWEVWYDIGGGLISLGTETVAIGANCQLRLGAVADRNISVDLDNLVVTGSGIYWDTKGDGSAIKDTYNEQDVGAGSIITFGTAVFTEGANMLYDYKIGSAVRVYGKTSAQIIALGNKVTDTGKFKLWAAYGGVTAQVSWTSLVVPFIPLAGDRAIMRGVSRGVMRGVG